MVFNSLSSFLGFLWLVLQNLSFIFAEHASFRSLGPVDTAVGFASPFPLPVSGSCTAGTQYTITSIQDLFHYGKDLECIFAAGTEPANVPLGYAYGHIVSIANTGFFSPIVQIAYQGDFVVKTQCNGFFYNIGWLSIAGIDVGTSVWTIDTLKWAVAPGEYPIGPTKSILMDFTVDFTKLCAAEGNESPIGLQGFSPFKNSMFPLSQFKDIGRVVGVDSDGGVIMLNKAYIYAEGQGAHTALIYAIKTFDSSVAPGLVRGVPIEVPLGPNGETTIQYSREGAEGLVARVLGILANPAELAREAAKRDVEQRQQVLSSLPLTDGTTDFSPFNVASLLAGVAGLTPPLMGDSNES